MDQVDLSNLHRQVLHSTASIGELKTKSAERTLKQCKTPWNGANRKT